MPDPSVIRHTCRVCQQQIDGDIAIVSEGDRQFFMHQSCVSKAIAVARFIEDQCVTGLSAGSTLVSDLYAAFLAYVGQDYPQVMSKAAFKTYLHKHGYRLWFDDAGWRTARVGRIALRQTEGGAA